MDTTRAREIKNMDMEMRTTARWDTKRVVIEIKKPTKSLMRRMARKIRLPMLKVTRSLMKLKGDWTTMGKMKTKVLKNVMTNRERNINPQKSVRGNVRNECRKSALRSQKRNVGT